MKRLIFLLLAPLLAAVSVSGREALASPADFPREKVVRLSSAAVHRRAPALIRLDREVFEAADRLISD